MNTLPEDVEKRFDEKFPYGGAIIEDDGRHYTFEDIKQFLAEELEKARAGYIFLVVKTIYPFSQMVVISMCHQKETLSLGSKVELKG